MENRQVHRSVAVVEDKKKQRPNSKYGLSRQNPDPLEGEKLHFYYNRDRRLDKAPQTVRRLYEEPKQKGFNLLRPLIADKPRATVFFTIIILAVVIIMFSLMGFVNKTHNLEGNKLEINGTKFENSTIIVINKTVRGQNPYTGAVDVGVSPVQSGSQDEEEHPFVTRIFFTLDKDERCEIAVPFDSDELIIVLQTEKSQIMTTIKPK